MMLDVCLEVSGSYAHLIGVDTVNAVLPLRPRHFRRVEPAPRVDRFEERLATAIDRLPFLLAHVLWLVDVCGSTYETAAAELATSPERVERLVADARGRLRDELISGPRRSPGGSTSRSRPGLPPPIR